MFLLSKSFFTSANESSGLTAMTFLVMMDEIGASIFMIFVLWFDAQKELNYLWANRVSYMCMEVCTGCKMHLGKVVG